MSERNQGSVRGVVQTGRNKESTVRVQCTAHRSIESAVGAKGTVRRSIESAAGVQGTARRSNESAAGVQGTARSLMSRQRRKRRRFHSLGLPAILLLLCLGTVIAAGTVLPSLIRFQGGMPGPYPDSGRRAAAEGGYTGQAASQGDFTQELQKLLALNEETRDYVAGYPDRDSYINGSIDLSEDFVSGQVPLLMQWDRRWGYDAYGDSMIGLAGCGPLCMTQAYLYFTGDTGMNPRKMADFAYDNGYYTSEGTSWSLWTEGAEKLGLSGRELSLNQILMERALDAGELIVCSMRPGDFTTSGHFILIRGYDENGFYVNDPNRRSNSSRQWDFDTLQYQIRNLWALGASG